MNANNTRLDALSRLYSLPALCMMALVAFFLVDVIPSVVSRDVSYLLIATLESILVLQLVLAWRQRLERLSLPHLYLLLMLFGLRLLYRLSSESPVLWGLRTGAVHNTILGAIGYGCGIVFLHPAIFQFIQTLGQKAHSWQTWKRILLGAGIVGILAWLFWTFPSNHITRDGFDWIKRTAADESVWHLYMREPLIIGLYRVVFLFVWPRYEMTSAETIALLSTLTGIGWTVCFLLFVSERFENVFDRGLSLVFVLSSGGLLVLFFGHIEVYPIFIAGSVPVFYFVQRYLNGKGGMPFIALTFAIAFLLHLSSGWLLPAFLMLPFINQKASSKIKDFLMFCGIFAAAQLAFWSALLVFCYSSDLNAMLARLHETFNVGPDKSMFLPQWLWFHPLRLIDLMNEYLYLSMPCLVLSPLALFYGIRYLRREFLFWFVLASGFFAYSFFWNPDRGFPEDWDLFSALPFFSSLFIIGVFIPTINNGNSGEPENTLFHRGRTLIYLAAFGFLPFACSQVWYHYSVPFIPPMYR